MAKTSPVNKRIKNISIKAKGGRTGKSGVKTPKAKQTNGKSSVSKPISIEQELAQRNAELAIINSVQNALAAKLEMQAIYELVGDMISEISGSEIVVINTWNHKTGTIRYEYIREKGKRVGVIERPFTPLNKMILPDLEDGKSIIWNDGMKERLKQFSHSLPAGEMPLSVVSVPVKTGDRINTSISLQDTRGEHAFDESIIRLLETLAGSTGIALENARLFDETQRLLKETEQRAAELAIINSVQKGLASKLEIQSIIDLVGEKLGEIFPDMNVVQINLYDKVRNLIHIPYCVEKGIRHEHESREPWGFRKHVIESRQSLIINENEDEISKKYGNPVITGEQPKSLAFVPLMAGDQVRGIISLQNMERENAFADSTVQLLTTLASSMSVALENARLFDETQRLLKETEQRNAELAIINSVQAGLASKLDMKAIYDLVGDKIQEIFDAQSVLIITFEHSTELTHIPYNFEKGQRYYPDPNPFTGLHRHLIRSGKTVLINEDADKYQNEWKMVLLPGTEAPKSLVFVPLNSGSGVNGAISLQNIEREHAFRESDVRLLETLSSSMSVALENARLFNETQRLLKETEQRAAELTTINTISNALAGELDLSALIELVGEQIRNAFNADIAYVALLDEEADAIRFPYTYGEELTSMQYGEGLTSKIIQSGRPLLINQDIEKRRVELGATQVGIRARSYLGVPIFVSSKAIGVISVQSTEQENVFTENDERLLGTIAANVGVALQNARLFDETQTRNREITQALEQQTATSGILQVIASSPTQIQPVLDVIAQNAAQLSGSDDALIDIEDKGILRVAAHYGNIPMFPVGEGIPLNRDSVAGRAMIEGHTLQALHKSTGEESEYPEGDKWALTYGYQVTCSVPLMREGKAIGAITIRRLEPRLLNEKQITLVETFASQAVIAIENVRLFNEVTRRKEYFEALFQNNPVAVVTIDNDATITSWNPAAEELFGYTREEAIGQNVDDLVAKTEEIYAEAVNYSRKGLDVSSDAFQAIVKRTRKDRSIVDVELSAVPIIVQGEKQGIFALYHDITELQRARQEAIAANEAKSSFLATMSHEIRTPMNAVIGMSSLLMDTPLNKEQRDYAETIRNSGDALLAIINDILDFSKIEAGRMEVENQPFDLRECVESALDLTAGHAIEKGLDIAYLIDDDVPAGIKSDVTRLRQILINLLSNAIKFTEKGEVVLTVKKGKAKDELLFTVRDTGVGVSESHMARLFQSFSQADSSTTRKFGGTGLGLAISKRLAEMMGGEMHAESEGIGKGSTFIFTIKAEPAKVAERKTSRDIKDIQSILHDKRVLIVDDNATNRRILALQTGKWGMTPRETEHPREALQWIENGQEFELAILDLQMPEMDGIMLTREIRKLRDEKLLPIILLTSLGRREIDAEDLEFAAYLTKPLKPSALYDALAGLFARNVISPKGDPVKSVIDAELGKRHPLRILLAEDNAVNQKLALRILEQMGYRADVASNGIEAIESIERQVYDVILMDVQMPEMDGLDATRNIRKLANVTQPHIIAMTANAMEGDREMCLAAGMDDYIAKPIRVNELVEALVNAERK